MTGLKIEDVTCTFCGCVCDDIFDAVYPSDEEVRRRIEKRMRELQRGT